MAVPKPDGNNQQAKYSRMDTSCKCHRTKRRYVTWHGALQPKEWTKLNCTGHWSRDHQAEQYDSTRKEKKSHLFSMDE